MSFLIDESATKLAVEGLLKKTNSSWVLFGYTDGSDNVAVLDQGAGFDELKARFAEDTVLYGLIAYPVEEATCRTIKNILITWVGPKVKPLHKARSSQHRVLLYNFADPLLSMHGEFQALALEEISNEIILRKFIGTQTQSEGGPIYESSNQQKGVEQFGFEDEAQVKDLIINWRNAKPNWIAFGYPENKTTLEVLGSGDGRLNELAALFADEKVVYGLLGVVDDAEQAYKVKKNILITWVGPNVKPLHKARSSQHRMLLYKFADEITKMHGEIQLEDKHTPEDVVLAKVIGSVVQENSEEQLRKAAEIDAQKKAAREAASATGAKLRTSESESFNNPLANQEEAKKAIHDVNDPKTDTNWVAFGYAPEEKDKKKGAKNLDQGSVVILGTGAGGLAEVSQHFSDSAVVYVLLAVPVLEVEYTTTKFIFITWVGPEVKPLFKARSSQHRVSLYNFADIICPMHAELQALAREHITEEKIREKLTGSKVFDTPVDASKAAEVSSSRRSQTFSASTGFTIKSDEYESLCKRLQDPNDRLNWVAFGYQGQLDDNIYVTGKGEGNHEEIKQFCIGDQIFYAVLGVPVDEGDYSTVKRMFITWVGPDVKPLLKARSSQHRVLLYNRLNSLLQLHGEMQIAGGEELTDKSLQEKLAGSRMAEETNSKKNLESSRGSSKGGAQDVFAVENEEDVTSAIKQLYKLDLKWLVFGYKHEINSNVHLIDRGTTGFEEVKAHIKDDEIQYAVLGIRDPNEGHYGAYKFIFLAWVGPETKPLIKARSSQHRVLLYNLIKKILPLHGELQILNQSEYTLDLVFEKLFSFRNKSEEELRRAGEADRQRAAVRSGLQPTGDAQLATSPSTGRAATAPESTKNPLTDQTRAITVVKDIGNTKTDTNWVVFGYEKTDVKLVASGAGGLDAFISNFKDDTAAFAILGHAVASEGDYTTLKYIFIHWCGESVKPLEKARSSQHRVLLYNYFNKYLQMSAEFQATNVSQLTGEALTSKLIGSSVLSESETQQAASDVSKVVGRRATVSGKNLKQFEVGNEAELKETLDNLRADTGINWVLFGRNATQSETVDIIAKGADLADLKSQLKDSDINYAVVARNLKDEDEAGYNEPRKYIFLAWIGKDVKPLQKAASSQQRVALYNHINKLSQLHGEIQALTQEDITEDKVREKLTGSRVH